MSPERFYASYRVKKRVREKENEVCIRARSIVNRSCRLDAAGVGEGRRESVFRFVQQRRQASRTASPSPGNVKWERPFEIYGHESTHASKLAVPILRWLARSPKVGSVNASCDPFEPRSDATEN